MKKVVAMLVVMVMSIMGGIWCSTRVAQAQQDDRIVVRKSDLPPELLKKYETMAIQEQMGKYSEYIQLGKAAGIAVREGLEALSDQADKFSKTGPGKFTMLIIGWKVIGKSLMQFIIGVPFLAIGIIIWIWSYRKSCLPYKVQIEETIDPTTKKVTGIKYKVMNDRSTERAADISAVSARQWSHFLAFLILVGIAALITFA